MLPSELKILREVSGSLGRYSTLTLLLGMIGRWSLSPSVKVSGYSSQGLEEFFCVDRVWSSGRLTVVRDGEAHERIMVSSRFGLFSS